jgi:hypothetical protein
MMKIEWTILAEGLGTAANGAVTAIGLNQNLILTPTLPVMTKRAVLAHLTAEDGALAEAELGIAVRVLSPVGQVLAALTTLGKVGPQPWPDLPVSFDLYTELPLRLTDYGTYVVEVDVTGPEGASAKSQTNFYVRGPLPTALQP